MLRVAFLALGAILLLVLGACAPARPADTPTPTGPATKPASPAAPPAGASPIASPPAAVSPVSVPPEARAPTDAALNDAATRLGVSAAQLRVERVESREWPDASLGCGQPGMFYAQVITPGYVVIVAGGAKRLEYHTDTRDRAVFCNEA